MKQCLIVETCVPPKSGCVGQLLCLTLLWLVAASAHAASIYKCLDAHGHLAYQDTPCAARTQQREIDVQPLPTIGDPSEVAASKRALTRYAQASSRSARARRGTHRSSHPARKKSETSWECRAVDGELFYRHTRCPGSIPGDGVVRWQDGGDPPSGKRSRRRRNAWGTVSVHGKKITRAEACRRIHSAGAAGRDGHARDETVSTYDHLMGRDPCDNA